MDEVLHKLLKDAARIRESLDELCRHIRNAQSRLENDGLKQLKNNASDLDGVTIKKLRAENEALKRKVTGDDDLG